MNLTVEFETYMAMVYPGLPVSSEQYKCLYGAWMAASHRFLDYVMIENIDVSGLLDIVDQLEFYIKQKEREAPERN